MAIFLNTTKYNHWIPRLINESKDELVLIVPYIQTSENIYETLLQADKRDVEITLVYRENKLSSTEKEKLKNLNNINLLHHPNIHCKCYYNGDFLILGSMNLYEYSEKNNREMGILLHRESIKEADSQFGFGSADKRDLFIDAVNEIREIINGASLEKVSSKAKETAFTIDIIKTYKELEQDHCDRINQYFLNKKFEPYEYAPNKFKAICKNYFDKIDVLNDGYRIAIDINIPENEREKLYEKWMKTYEEYEFKGFKYYWNYYKSDILLYRDFNFDWESITDEAIYYKKLQQGIQCIINKYRKLSGK